MVFTTLVNGKGEFCEVGNSFLNVTYMNFVLQREEQVSAY
jgi:hypothetical protein